MMGLSEDLIGADDDDKPKGDGHNATSVVMNMLHWDSNKHGKKINVIKQLAFSQTRHHYQHATSLHDAKISWKIKQEKDKLLPGKRPKTLAEIQALMKDNIEMENWSKEMQEKMIQRVQETVIHVEQELSNLTPRTGAMAIALFTQAHVDDTFTPNIFASSGAEGFIQEILYMNPLDLVQKFEQVGFIMKKYDVELTGFSSNHHQIFAFL
ncbi:hypothetical protein F5146DRAFT_1003912 [Armillaria mellea]|nr:hypothetical protein F5146DRAFT_1003912 [Armillaria mellea]